MFISDIVEGDRNDEKSEKEEVEGGREWRGWSALCRVPESGRPISTGPGWGCGLSSRSGSGEGRMTGLSALCFSVFLSETGCTTSGATDRPKEQAMDLLGKILR